MITYSNIYTYFESELLPFIKEDLFQIVSFLKGNRPNSPISLQQKKGVKIPKIDTGSGISPSNTTTYISFRDFIKISFE